jgi:hypothetical protein
MYFSFRSNHTLNKNCMCGYRRFEVLNKSHKKDTRTKMTPIRYMLQGTYRLTRSKFHRLSRFISFSSKLSYGRTGPSVPTLPPQGTNIYTISHFKIQVITLSTKPVYSFHTILYIHTVPNRTDAFSLSFMVRHTSTVKVRPKMASSQNNTHTHIHT